MSNNQDNGNVAVMRDALVETLNKVNDAYDILSKSCVILEEARQACREARGIIIPALSMPDRQCDVGTAEEQYDRFKKYCFNYMGDGMDEPRCSGCPLGRSKSSCKFEWEQMPYDTMTKKCART